MPRPSADEIMMSVAGVMATRSTCSRLNVGVVLTKDGRLVSSGWNGAPAKFPHCTHPCNCHVSPDGTLGMRHWETCASLLPCEISVHAESNSIAFAARYGIATSGTTMYCTHQPCLKCAQLTINAGVSRVVFGTEYRDASGVELLKSVGVSVERLLV